MSRIIPSLALIVATTALLGACGGRPADSAPGAAAAAGTAASGSFQGIPVYPGMTELMTHDTPAGTGAALHTADYRSSDKPEQIRAYYHAQLAKLYGEQVVTDQMLSDGMIKLGGGVVDQKAVTVLIHPGDSGEQIVGIQVIGKN